MTKTENKKEFLKELTKLCRKYRLEICIDVHNINLTLSDIDYYKKLFPNFKNLDDFEYKLNGDDDFDY